VKLPAGKTVGLEVVFGGIESPDRVANAFQKALNLVGVKLIYCDGMGTPSGWNTCGQSLLAEHVDALVTVGIDSSAIPNVMSSAKAANIPVLEFSGQVPPGYDGAYYPNESHSGRILASYVVKKLETLTRTKKIVIENYAAPYGQERTNQLTAALKKAKGIKVAAEGSIDPANVTAGTQALVRDQLTANPGVKAFWFTTASAGQAGAKVIAQKFAGKHFPQKPLVATFYADPSTQALMRQGVIDVVADVDYDASAWMTADQLLEHWARGSAFSQSPDVRYPGVPDLFSYQIVTPSTLPKTRYVEPKFDVVSFYESKWKAEFGASFRGPVQ